MRSTFVRATLVLLLLPATMLAGCALGPAPAPAQNSQDDPAPVPDDPGPEGLADGEAWIVEGANDYVDGSSPVCADEDLLTNAEAEFLSIYLEQGPGMPDDWKPGDAYQVSSDGILIDFGAGTYNASRFDGDDSTGIGTAWETFGQVNFERDAQGVITGGSGTGKTRILHENGDVEKLTDSMTFTVSIMDEPTWCTIPVGE